jgi:hypothetical protein
MIPANLLAYPPWKAAMASGNFPEVGRNVWRTALKGLDLQEQRDKYNEYRAVRHQRNQVTQARMDLHATRYAGLIQQPRVVPHI